MKLEDGFTDMLLKHAFAHCLGRIPILAVIHSFRISLLRNPENNHLAAPTSINHPSPSVSPFPLNPPHSTTLPG